MPDTRGSRNKVKNVKSSTLCKMRSKSRLVGMENVNSNHRLASHNRDVKSEKVVKTKGKAIINKEIIVNSGKEADQGTVLEE